VSSLDHSRVVRDVTARLATASTAVEACQATVATLAQHIPAQITVLLWVHDRLRCVAATGSWQVIASVPPGRGTTGRVYASGKTEVVPVLGPDSDHVALRPDLLAEICTPVVDPAGRPIGVLDVRWSTDVDLDTWRDTAERVAGHLGARIAELGGPPAESRSERLLRHASALTAATTEADLIAAAVQAARDVTGLASAVFVLDSPTGPRLATPSVAPGALESRVHAALVGAGRPVLERLRALAHRHGTSYTLGEDNHPTTPDQDVLIAAGIRTLISVPLGPSESSGVLLVGDTRTLQPDPTTVGVIELLAAQTWLCLERLRSLAHLRERASSDPLTGLRHHGSFGERIADLRPEGRTALLAVDVDDFKSINDTYGHQAGDRALVELARALQGALRHGDELYRTGGDEFVAVVDVGRADEALGIAQRLIEAARRTGRTISVGVAVRRDDESPDRLLRRADEALYDVKRRGGDGVGVATD
jgi:diguanylate cyclase (GGDEF)-like protein